LDVHVPILSVARLAQRAIAVANLHGGWIGGKCRLAKVTIASGFGARIDAGYGAIAIGYFITVNGKSF